MLYQGSTDCRTSAQRPILDKLAVSPGNPAFYIICQATELCSYIYTTLTNRFLRLLPFRLQFLLIKFYNFPQMLGLFNNAEIWINITL